MYPEYSDKLSALIVVGCLFLFACNQNTNQQSANLSGFTMGTTYTVQINSGQTIPAVSVLTQSIEQVLDSVNTAMSTYIPDSELSRLNQSGSNDWISLSTPLFEVIYTAQEISMMSNGAFDITIGPLVNIWGFGPNIQPELPPDDLTIKSLLEIVGFKKLYLDNSKKLIRKDLPGIYIDLSAIAKGYAVDEVAHMLENKYTIQNYMVEIGGEIQAHGTNAQGKAWRIGIEKPVTDQRSVERTINLDNMAMATSGNYRNYIDVNGIRYSHVIDPRTGKPVQHQLASVTVLHSHCMIADAWATALLVSGPESGLRLAEQNGLDALFIIRENNNFREQHTGKFAQYFSD
jgi:FAD:protein FMN transferase